MTKVSKKIKKRNCFLKKTMVLTFLLISTFLVNAQQQIVVKGKIIDEKTNEEITGATIKIKDSGRNNQSGVITDVNGNFSITVKSLPVTLIVSYIGYKEQETDIYEYSTPVSIFLTSNFIYTKVINKKSVL